MCDVSVLDLDGESKHSVVFGGEKRSRRFARASQWENETKGALERHFSGAPVNV